MHDSRSEPVHLYQRLSEEQINIVFLSAWFLDRKSKIICCVEPNKIDLDKKVDLLEIQPNERIDYLPSVCILSIYPHQFRLKTLGCLLSFFGVEKVKFHYFASSPSMLSFIIDNKDGETIARRLAKYIDLPLSHTPYHQEVNVEEFMKYFKKEPETSATYTEKKVKTYGIQTKSNMVLCRLEIDLDQLSAWGKAIQLFEDFGVRFYYASSFISKNNRIDLLLVLETDNHLIEDLERHVFPGIFSEGLHRHCHIVSLVDFIYFHGPHFGDRYGIATHAFSALRKKNIPILLTGCAGSSINIVVPLGMIQKSREALLDVFEMP